MLIFEFRCFMNNAGFTFIFLKLFYFFQLICSMFVLEKGKVNLLNVENKNYTITH